MNYQEIFEPTEWTHLKDVMSSIHHNIPEHHMNLVWNSYLRIEKVNIPQPCSCASSSKHWLTAVNTINNFIKENA
jgi:hypothetical protein